MQPPVTDASSTTTLTRVAAVVPSLTTPAVRNCSSGSASPRTCRTPQSEAAASVLRARQVENGLQEEVKVDKAACLDALLAPPWRDVVARGAPAPGTASRALRGGNGAACRRQRRQACPPALCVSEPVRLPPPVRHVVRAPTPVPLSVAAAEAAGQLGLAQASWFRVGPDEYRRVLSGATPGATKAAFAPMPGVVPEVLAFAAAADPASAKRRLRRAIALAPLDCRVQVLGPRACEELGPQKASAWDAASIAAACPWRYRRTHRRRAKADFRPDAWQQWHRRVCAHCRARPAGTLQLDSGDVVTVDPDCTMFGMAMRLWCGLELPLSSPLPRRVWPNHGSVQQHAAAIDAQIHEQVEAGFLEHVQPEQVHATVPLLAAVRPADARRAAMDGSRPKIRVCSDFSKAGVNDRCPAWAFAFPRVRDVLAHIGPGWAGGVADVSAFYRRLPWDQRDTKYFGISWRGKLYRDRVLTFGSNITPAAAQAVSSSIAEFVVFRAVTELNVEPADVLVVPYLDDILFAARSLDVAQRLEALVVDTFEACGLPLPHKKRQHAATSWTWIGWRFDTRARTLAVTSAKRGELASRIRALVSSAEAGEGVRRAELRSLVCALSHYRLAIPGSAARLSALFRALTVSRLRRRAQVQLDSWPDALRDLRWFVQAIVTTDGVSIWRDWEREAVIICTDASGEPGPQSGFGAIMFDGSAITMWQRAWTAAELQAFAAGSDSSTLRELTAALAAAEHWQHAWQGRPVLFLLDSSAAACTINRGRAAFSPSCASAHAISLRLSDLFMSARSCCVAWWLRRDTATIQAADILSRTNTRSTPSSRGAFHPRRGRRPRQGSGHLTGSRSRLRRARRRRARQGAPPAG